MKQNKSEPIKILHLHTRAIVGGSGTNTLLTLEGLPREKFDCHLACGLKEAQECFLEEIKSKKITFHVISRLRNQINPISDCLAFFEILALIKKGRYSIVHTHNSKAGILGRLAAKAAGVPVIVHTIHSCEFNYDGVSFLLRKFFIFLEKLAAPLTDHFIAISDHIKEEFLKHRLVKEDRITVIYSGIEIEKFKSPADRTQKREELKLRQSDFIVAVIARLERNKGHDDILRASPRILQENKDVRFLFVGEGPLRYRLEEKAKNVNMETHVIFLGLRKDVAEILQAVDVVCLASYYEGMGRVLLEAQASGKPVVATRVGGIPNVVRENETAFLINAKDPNALADALLRLARNPELKKKMGEAAARFVDERFSAQRMVESIEKIYDNLLLVNSG